MILCNSGKGKSNCNAPVGLPAECIRGDAGRPVVIAYHSGHDVVGSQDIQGVPGLLRTASVKHIGRPVAQAGGVRNHPSGARPVRWAKVDLPAYGKGNGPRAGLNGDGALGRKARRNRKPAAHPPDAKKQAEILGADPPTLGASKSHNREEANRYDLRNQFGGTKQQVTEVTNEPLRIPLLPRKRRAWSRRPRGRSGWQNRGKQRLRRAEAARLPSIAWKEHRRRSPSRRKRCRP